MLKTRYKKLCASAKHRGIPVTLTEIEYTEIIGDGLCHYCGNAANLGTTGYGLDRMDTFGIYSKDNCVCCCVGCNTIKGSNLSYDEMLLIMSKRKIDPFSLGKYQHIFEGLQVQKLDKFYLINRYLRIFIHAFSQIKPYMASKNQFSFYEEELDSKPEVVRSMILHRLGKIETKYYARKLEIRKVLSCDSKPFIESNHLKGYNPAITFGLYDSDSNLLMLMSYKKIKNNIVSIHRFCSKRYCIVVGGFSKLLAKVIKESECEMVESFVDRRFHYGEGLLKNGFQAEPLLSKSWFWTDGYKKFNRLKCRANMDSRGLSQKEHAEELGWWKIYDAGQQKFVLTLQTLKVSKHTNNDCESWTELNERLTKAGLTLETTLKEYSFLERHKPLSIRCKNNHLFNRARTSLLHNVSCPECKSLSNTYTFKDKLKETGWNHIGDEHYENKSTYLTCRCKDGHTLIRTYRYFRNTECMMCKYQQNLLRAKPSEALSGNSEKRRRRVFDQIFEHCLSTDQKLITTWDEFKESKVTSATTPIYIECISGTIRKTIWQSAKDHGCGCVKCRANKPHNIKKTKFELNSAAISTQCKVGDTYGSLSVTQVKSMQKIICNCVCGTELVSTNYKIQSGLAKSCGCMRHEEKTITINGTDILPKEEIDRRLAKARYKRLEGVIEKMTSQLKVECLECHTVKTISWMGIFDNCVHCYRISLTKKAYDKITSQAIQKDYEVLDTFEDYFHKCQTEDKRNSLIHISIKCPQGHIRKVIATTKSWRCIECLKVSK